MTTTSEERAPTGEHGDIVYPSTIPFVIVHLACFAAIWTGVTWQALAIGVGLYWLRIFAIGAGYHRYFSHRAYETSRVFQFVLAVARADRRRKRACLWWAANHRDHHLHSDTELDVHSPRHTGFLYSHRRLDLRAPPRHDRSRQDRGFRALSRADVAAPLRTAAGLSCSPCSAFCVAGWPGLVVGFFWSTVLVYHATFCINSLAHVRGRKRYVTGDDSRNNWLLAIITMGEGWHNNHHAYQSSARQGFRWWEYDPTFYLLTLSWLGVVWDLKRPPREVAAQRASARHPGHRPRRRAARRQLQPGADRGRGRGRAQHGLAGGVATPPVGRSASGGRRPGQRPIATSPDPGRVCRPRPRDVCPYP